MILHSRMLFVSNDIAKVEKNYKEIQNWGKFDSQYVVSAWVKFCSVKRTLFLRFNTNKCVNEKKLKKKYFSPIFLHWIDALKSRKRIEHNIFDRHEREEPKEQKWKIIKIVKHEIYSNKLWCQIQFSFAFHAAINDTIEKYFDYLFETRKSFYCRFNNKHE